jgi:hypothetical protein
VNNGWSNMTNKIPTTDTPRLNMSFLTDFIWNPFQPPITPPKCLYFYFSLAHFVVLIVPPPLCKKFRVLINRFQSFNESCFASSIAILFILIGRMFTV